MFKKSKLPLWLLANSTQQPVLRATSQPVPIADIQKPEFQKLIDDMIDTMYKSNGIGLAASQIGRNLRLVVIDGQVNQQSEALVMINPQISNFSPDQQVVEEGCLSIPKVYGLVGRAKQLTLRAFDRDGQSYTINAEHLLARVIQHEFDHLNGRLFIDRTSKITQGEWPPKNTK